MSEQKSELLLAGMDDYTTKPVSEAQLAHLLNRWLDSAAPHFEPSPVPPDTGPAPGSSTQQSRNLFEILDLSESLRLANYKPRLAHDMLEMLLANLANDKTKIAEYFSARDWENLEFQVHRLHGGCCYCGVPELRNASDLVDKLLQKKFFNELAEPVDTLLKAIETLQEWEREHDIKSLFSDENGAL
jgi:two-component system sensor histidine kinase BarA